MHTLIELGIVFLNNNVIISVGSSMILIISS